MPCLRSLVPGVPKKSYPVSGKSDLAQFKINIVERFNNQKNHADSVEPFKNIVFQKGYGRFSKTGVTFLWGHR